MNKLEIFITSKLVIPKNYKTFAKTLIITQIKVLIKKWPFIGKNVPYQVPLVGKQGVCRISLWLKLNQILNLLKK